ncbi:hypothetical protein [Streptomyces sp. NPDC007984]|uniref:hypothetical protein n=1 Tax=Streptomyces sp. NPDC007984 TaxID=3364801 RepID=UPI0036E6DAB7
MHHARRSAPATGTTRRSSRVAAVLAVVVLALVTTLGGVTPGPGASGAGPAAAPVAADHHRYDGTRADDGCDAVRVVRAAMRHDHPPGEHPAPRAHLGTCGRGTHATPGPVPGPYAARTGHVPSAQPPAAQDQGRAPPLFSGI